MAIKLMPILLLVLEHQVIATEVAILRSFVHAPTLYWNCGTIVEQVSSHRYSVDLFQEDSGFSGCFIQLVYSTNVNFSNH